MLGVRRNGKKDGHVRSSVISFLAAVAVGAAAPYITNWLDRRFRPPTESFVHAPSELFPRPSLIRTAAFAAVAGWISGVAFVVLLIVSLGIRELTWTAVTAVALLLGFAILEVGISVVLRCPKCLRRILVQSTTKPPFSDKYLGLSGWAAIAAQVAARREFRCMYCGQRFHVTPNNAVHRTGARVARSGR